MRRMRAALNVGALASSLICIAVIIIWLLGRRHTHYLEWNRTNFNFNFVTGGGLAYVGLTSDTVGVPRCTLEHNDYPSALWTGWRPGPGRWGFALYLNKTIGPPVGRWKYGGRVLNSVFLPLWFIALISLSLPLWRLSQILIRRRRHQPGACLHCGYSLTGNTSGVCPELTM
jgi:hypothetical protein